MEYLEIKPEEFDEIAKEIERQLTHGKVIIDEIKRKCEEGRYFGIKAVENGELAGFYTYVDDVIECTVPHPELEKEIEEFAAGEKVTTGDAIFIHPNFQRRGLGMELARRVSAHAKSKGAKYFITEAWIHPNGSIPSHKAFLCNGEVVWEKTIPLFYKDMDKLGMECPICGKNCICGAELQLHKL